MTSSNVRRWAVDAGVAAAAAAPALVDQATTDNSSAAWWILAGYIVVAVAGLLVRRRWPLPVFAVTLLALAVAEVWGSAIEIQLSTLSVLAVGFAIYAVGAYSPLPASIAAVAGGAAIVAGGLWVNHATAPEGWRGGSDVIAVVAPLSVAWALGVVWRSRQQVLVAAEQRADDALREQALLVERAAHTERVRIAQDMHDVVAHSLTLLVIHAETIRARAHQLPPWAREQVDALAAAGRQATTEMRDLLGVLRDGTAEAAPRTPAPTLADLPDLVDAAQAAGNPVTTSGSGPVHALPRPVQLAGYRVIQEALTNARRHAPGAAVHIHVDATDSRLRLAVTNQPPPPGAATTPGTGLGVAGMKERVTALGGDLHAGSTPTGGYQVTAVLPITATRENSHADAG